MKLFNISRNKAQNNQPGSVTAPAAAQSQAVRAIRPQVNIVIKNIIESDADAIVNAANPLLQRGDGVCGVIFQAAGYKLDDACKKLRGCAVGKAKVTDGFELVGKKIIHAVGPDCRMPDQNSKRKTHLKSAYQEIIRLADKEGIKKLAIPSISTGIYGFDIHEAAEIAVNTVDQELRHCSSLVIVDFCCYGPDQAQVQSALSVAANKLKSASLNRTSGVPQSQLHQIFRDENLSQSTERRIQISGDSITTFTRADSWVNPTDPNLTCGGVVSNLIKNALGGTEAITSGLHECPIGEAVTNGAKLGQRGIRVIHVAGPQFDAANPAHSSEVLASCYQSAVKLADDKGYKSIVIPAISTGGQGFPLKEATSVAFSAVEEALQDCKNIKTVTLCYYGGEAESIYSGEHQKYLDKKPAADTPSSQIEPFAAGLGSIAPEKGLQRFKLALTEEMTQQICIELLTTKKSHFMWFAFPQIAGLGSSDESRKYGISDIDEALAFLDDPELKQNVCMFTELITSRQDICSASKENRVNVLNGILGELDAQKFHASVSLFALAENSRGSTKNIFQDSLNEIFNGAHHPGTLKLLLWPDTIHI